MNYFSDLEQIPRFEVSVFLRICILYIQFNKDAKETNIKNKQNEKYK